MASRATRAVVIDDTDRNIRYTDQGWFQGNRSQDEVGNFGPTYLHTLHGTNVNGSLAYTFQGTSVRVVGTTKLTETPAGMFDPSWECFVDKISIGATKPFEFAENNWVLCEKSDLADGQHEIVVNVNTIGQTFWFDNIQYTPSPSISLETPVVLVDNYDPGIIFDSKWQALGNTANMTQSAGSTATFLFTGTSVSWVGFIPQELPHDASSATYSVDGGPPIVFPLNGLPSGDVPTDYNQIFFTTPELPAGPHTLVVVHNGTSLQTPLMLDFLYVTNTSTPITPSISNPTTAKGPAPTSLSPAPQPIKDRTPVGAIAGGAVAGIILISLTLFPLWRYRRRFRRAGPYTRASEIRTPSHVTVSPFTSHSASRAGRCISKVYRDILINPSFHDGLGPQMHRGAVTRPSRPLQPPLVSTVTTEDAVGPQMQRGPVTTQPYPSSLPPATDHIQPTPAGAAQRAPSPGPLSSPELHTPVVNTITQTTPMAQVINPEEHAGVIHQDSGLRFSAAVISDVPPVYTEA